MTRTPFMTAVYRLSKAYALPAGTRAPVSSVLTDQVDRLIEHTATCDCGREVDLTVYVDTPYRVVRKCSCGLTSLCYPLDQAGDLERLRQWTQKSRDEARQERAEARRLRRAENGHPDA